MSNLLWAYASLGWAPAHLLASLAMETLRQLPFFKFQVSHSTFCLLYSGILVLADVADNVTYLPACMHAAAAAAAAAAGREHHSYMRQASFAMLTHKCLAAQRNALCLWLSCRASTTHHSTIHECPPARHQPIRSFRLVCNAGTGQHLVGVC